MRETEAIWDSQDTARLRELWDTDDVEPYYLAGEQENWFIGWDAIDAYLAPPRGAPKITQAIRVRFYDVRARWLAPDLYIQKLYEKDISPEYEAFYNQMMKKPG